MGVSCTEFRNNRGLLVVTISLALFLDGLLITVLVPILPNLLRDIEAKSNHAPKDGSSFNSTASVLDQDLDFNNLNISDAATENSGDDSPHGPAGENTRVGLLLAGKMTAQLISNLFVASVTTRVGYSIPMFVGMFVLLVSTIVYVLFDDYAILFIGRGVQGIACAFTSTSGAGLMASVFTDQKERSLVQNLIHSGLTAGVMVGPPLGGVLYDLTGGKKIPYLTLTALIALELVLMLFFITPKYKPENNDGPSFFRLLGDPHIFVTAVVIAMASLGLAFIEPILPTWMFNTMGSSVLEQGIVLIPSSVAEFLCMSLFGVYANRAKCYHPRHSWIYTLFGILLIVGGALAIPESSSFSVLVLPLIAVGSGFGLACGNLVPYMGFLVDKRHGPVYAAAYAIVEDAFNLSFAIGPATSGILVDELGFTWAVRTGAIGCSLACFLVLFLIKSPKRKEMNGPGSYNNKQIDQGTYKKTVHN